MINVFKGGYTREHGLLVWFDISFIVHKNGYSRLKLLPYIRNDRNLLAFDVDLKFQRFHAAQEMEVEFPSVGTVVWAKVGVDPWWPAVILGSSRRSTAKDWMRMKGTKKQFRCVFLQAEETYSWLDLCKIRPFKEEDSGCDRPPDYITNVSKCKKCHSVAIQLASKILADPSNLWKYLMDTQAGIDILFHPLPAS